MKHQAINRCFYYLPDDDTPKVPDHLDDLATPQARRMQRLIDDLNGHLQTVISNLKHE